jgi:hypothetical protein
MKILIIRPAALGDTLMLAPALDQLRHSASVRLVGRMPGLEYLRPFAGQCLDFEGAGWHSLFTGNPEVAALPEADLTVAFLKDPDGMVKRNLDILLPAARIHMFPGLPAPEENVHVAFHLARCLEAAGADLAPAKAMQQALSRPLLRGTDLSVGEGRIVVHPGSGSREKNHAPELWMEVVSGMRTEPLFRRRGLTVLLGPAEEGLRPFFEKQIRDRDARIAFSPGRQELVSLLEGSDLYVGQDSGITHLAAMLGTPTIALFRKPSVLQWRPLGPKVRVILNPEPDPDLVMLVLSEAGFLMEGHGEDR